MKENRRERPPVFMNRVNPDLLIRTIERVLSMRLERLTGEQYEVTARFVPRDAPQTETLCPSNDIGCPYYTESGCCTLDDPAHECDDYQYYTGCCDEE